MKIYKVDKAKVQIFTTKRSLFKFGSALLTR